MKQLKRPRFVIAGTGSGVGKTTFTLGLMAAFKKRGLQVQGFKAGPDYIDPSYHTAITGRKSRNLDSWMVSPDTMKEIFLRGSEGSDLSIIEGVMGFYDGKDPRTNQGSTAEISEYLRSPVILVMNASSIARSAAAIVLGFQQLSSQVNIAGVIVNQVGSIGHYQLVKTAVEQECHIPVLGYLEKNDELMIPERHLGLIPAVERGELQPLFQQLSDLIEERIDLDSLLKIAEGAPDLEESDPVIFNPQHQQEKKVQIAVALDEAFNFYYPENLELLEWHGAELVYFSPLHGDQIPEEADGLYIGGGFPEEFAERLEQHISVKEDIRRRIADGLPTLAECGGYMYLAQSIFDHQGVQHEMAGVIPIQIRMQKQLAALGYREVTSLTDHLLLKKGEKARGHEFHYSSPELVQDDYPYANEVNGLGGSRFDGYTKGNLLAGYTHFYFASNPAVVVHWLEKIEEYRQKRNAKK